jgi:arabinogalactan endo-1,4-beta-galactosidase
MIRSRSLAGMIALVALGVFVAPAAPGVGSPAPQSESAQATRPVVNIAIDAPAVATTTADDHPASLATDGNAATSWCPSARTGTVTVALRGVRPILGFGVSLSGGDPIGTVSIEVGERAGDLQVAQAALAVRTGVPTWLHNSGPEKARLVRMTVDGSTGSVCVGELRVLGHDPDFLSPAVGHDMSFAVQEAAIGSTYTDRGVEGLPESILADHGANYVRLRIWTDPPGGYSDLDSVLEMARRAHAVGMRILLDFHYSDFWADPQKQPTPAAWADQDLTTLAGTVRAYTRDVLDALAAQGTPADMVQIGNEIRNGMLWPTGFIDWSTGDGWDNLGTLLRAGAQGVREAAGPTPKIVIHFDQGGDNWASRWFYDHVVDQRVPFDVIGLSYYPFWHGTIAQLRTNMNDLARRYGKEVQIVETQYGWTLQNGDNLGNFLWQDSQLVPGYPATPNGQLTFLFDLQSAVAAVPEGMGTGIFYWQPEWIPGVGWEPGAGTPNDNMTLFDFSGRALPSVQYTNPLVACDQYAPGQDPCTF